ncbi:MAG: hypothetical protein HW421_1057 [Ignavibacteria bacterium]|nr:hypothetical protein [Ignavibacteria bacterium]
MIKINKIEPTSDYILKLTFSDGFEKYLDFEKLIDFKGMAEPLKNIDYFRDVRIINNGRSFGWENEYDCCADWARFYAE